MTTIAAMIFRGEAADPEVWEDCHGSKWSPWVGLFLPLINNKHGFFQHFLFSGGLMEQPCASMRLMQIILGEYHRYLAEVNKVPGG